MSIGSEKSEKYLKLFFGYSNMENKTRRIGIYWDNTLKLSFEVPSNIKELSPFDEGFNNFLKQLELENPKVNWKNRRLTIKELK